MALQKIVVLDETDKIPVAELPLPIAQADVTGLVTDLSGKETANANIQAHVTASHAPSNAQKNSDILKSEVEAVLTGQLSSHSHAGGSGDMTKAVYDPDADGDIAEAQLQLDYPTHSNANDHAPNDDTDLDVTFEASLRNTDNHTSGTTNKVFTATEQTKLAGIETAAKNYPHTGEQGFTDAQATKLAGIATGAQVNNISDVNATDLTDGGQTALHSHAGGSEAFPVGSVFIAVVATNPNTLLGYGTWSAIAAGRMLVGLDSGDPDFDTAEETGGAKTKTIAQANLPNISTGAGTSHNHIQDQHRHQTLRERSATTGGAATQIARTADTSSTVDTAIFTEYTTPTNQPEAAHTHSLGGSGTALNVVNPYFVCYIWKRTA